MALRTGPAPSRARRSTGLLACGLLASAATLSCQRLFTLSSPSLGLRPQYADVANAGRAGLVARHANLVEIPSGMKRGLRIVVDGVPYQVLEFMSKKVGKGVAITKTKMKNLISGANVDKTLGSGERYEEVDSFWKGGTFSFFDAEENDYVFLDAETFEEMRVNADIVGEFGEWLTDGCTLEVEEWEGKAISVKLKGDIIMEVKEIQQKKDNGKDCTAVLSNGSVKSGPPYLEVGDKVLIDKATFEIIKRL